MSSQNINTGPTRERLQHAGDDVTMVSGEDGWPLTLRMDDSPIARLYRRGQRRPREGITGIQYQAGQVYYGNAYLAGLMASGVIDPTRSRVDGGQRIDQSHSRMAAVVRHERALRVLTRQSVEVLWAIVLTEMPLLDYARRFSLFALERERRSIALHRLREALDELIEHYGM